MLYCSYTLSIFIVVKNMPQDPILLIRCKHLELRLRNKITLLVKWTRRKMRRCVLFVIICNQFILIKLSDWWGFKVWACRHYKGFRLPNLKMHLLSFLKNFPLFFSISGCLCFKYTIMHSLCRWLWPQVPTIVHHCYLFGWPLDSLQSISNNLLLPLNDPNFTPILFSAVRINHHCDWVILSPDILGKQWSLWRFEDWLLKLGLSWILRRGWNSSMIILILSLTHQ